MTFDGSGTYGGFGNGFWAGHSFGLDGGALNNFNDLVVNNITADRIKARAIEAGFITADTISANYATIGELNAAVARIGTLEAKKINVNDLNISGNLNGYDLSWKKIDYVSSLDTRTVYVITAADGSKGETVSVVSGYSYGYLYILCGKG